MTYLEFLNKLLEKTQRSKPHDGFCRIISNWEEDIKLHWGTFWRECPSSLVNKSWYQADFAWWFPSGDVEIRVQFVKHVILKEEIKLIIKELEINKYISGICEIGYNYSSETAFYIKQQQPSILNWVNVQFWHPIQIFNLYWWPMGKRNVRVRFLKHLLEKLNK